MNILIVEDDVASLKILKKYLEQYGSVYTATTGEEAIQQIKGCNSGYAIVFLDIFLPGIDGIELLRIIREKERCNKSCSVKEKVVIVSSTDEEEYVSAAKRLGVETYIVKPINLDVLDKIMKKIYAENNGEIND